MSNKCEIDVVDFIFNNYEFIKGMKDLSVREKEIKDIELYKSINEKTMFIVISPNNRFFSNGNRIDKISDFDGQLFNYHILFSGTACRCLAVLDKNLKDDTILSVYYKSLKVSKTADGKIRMCIDGKKISKLKV